MSNSSNLNPAVGRFSSQMLTYFGVQKTVVNTGGLNSNTFKYKTSDTTYIDPGNVASTLLATGVSGGYSPGTYDYTISYFISRGAGVLYASTMASLAIDIATALNIPVHLLLERSESSGKTSFDTSAYEMFNKLRDPGHQVGHVTTVLNRNSLQSRSIRA